MLNVNRLRILGEVAHRGSFSAAADALSYTQSALCQLICLLEAGIGMTLRLCCPWGVSLTAAGQTLVGHAESVLADLDAAEAALAAIAGLRGGRLRMASFPTAGATLMPLAIATFRARHPDVELTLAEGEPEQIAPRLGTGELDLALLFEFDASPAEADGAGTGPTVGSGSAAAASGRLTRVELLQDPLYLALPRAHPLAERRRLRLEDLRGESWIQTSRDSPCARHAVRCCHAAGFEPSVSFESDDYQTVQGLVAAGVGVALIPELALSIVREDVVIRALSPHPPARRVIAATAAGARLLPAAPAMLSVLQEVASQYEALGASRLAA
jgi:DNA-binding transcriptional LysR family regulator